MEKYVPDIYQKSIYTINYDSLLSRGIKCLLFDLDNTLAPIPYQEDGNVLSVSIKPDSVIVVESEN